MNSHLELSIHTWCSYPHWKRSQSQQLPPRHQQAQLAKDRQGLDDAEGAHDAQQLHHPQAAGLLILTETSSHNGKEEELKDIQGN